MLKNQILCSLQCFLFFSTYSCLILTAGLKEPEVDMTTEQVIHLYGYPLEVHEVTTDDGYVLTLHRIPFGVRDNKKRRQVVLLQHGLLDSSFTWVNNGPYMSLGFILADNGFDVWLGNRRGNLYSRKHTSYSTSSNKFWDFTWDEMAAYDLPATINHIISVTGAPKVAYIGHSEGTEIGFAQFSKNTDLNSRVSAMVALAPAAYIGHVRSPVKLLTPIAGVYNLAKQIFTNGEFLPNSHLFTLLQQAACGTTLTSLLCGNIGFFFLGTTDGNLNHSRIPIYVTHIPGGTSMKNMVHYSQSVLSDRFQYYDYGFFGNLRHYKQNSVPQYNLDTHGLPVAVFYAGNDWLVSTVDAERTIRELGDNVKFMKYIPHYNHIDLVWGITAPELVFADIIKFLRRYRDDV